MSQIVANGNTDYKDNNDLYSILPCHDDEEVQSVPGVAQVTPPPKDAQRHHLDHHLHGEEDVDEGVEVLRGREEERERGIERVFCFRCGERRERIEDSIFGKAGKKLMRGKEHLKYRRTKSVKRPTERK